MKFPCPRCDHALEACRSLIGFSVRCPGCHHPVAVPKEAPPTPDAHLPHTASTPATPSPDTTATPGTLPKRRPGMKIPVAILATLILGSIGYTLKNATATPPPPPPETPSLHHPTAASPTAPLPSPETALSK